MQVAAIAQTFDVVKSGLERSAAATTYFTAIAGVTLLALTVGAATFWLIARAPRAGALIGYAVAAAAVEDWLGACIFPDGIDPTGPRLDFILSASHVLEWVPPVLIGCAIAWSGFRSVGRIVAAMVSLGLLWVTPALVTAIVNATASGGSSGYPREMIDAGVAVFLEAATMPTLVLPRLVRAVVVAVVVSVVLAGAALERSRRKSAAIEQ